MKKSARHGSAPGDARPDLSSDERQPIGIVKDWVAHKKREKQAEDAKTARLRALREAQKPKTD